MQSIHFRGIGNVKSGKYEDVIIDGIAKIKGAICSNSICINSKSTIKGSVTTGSTIVNGACNIKGDISSNLLNNSGYLKVKGKSICKDITNHGKYSTTSEIKSEVFTSDGVVKSRSDIEVQKFIANGPIIIKGMLQADTADITVKGVGFINQIKAKIVHTGKLRDVRLRPSVDILARLVLAPLSGIKITLNRININMIEGTLVDISFTNAELIRGEKVTIGPGCRVNRVEYAKSIEVSEDSYIGKKIKV